LKRAVLITFFQMNLGQPADFLILFFRLFQKRICAVFWATVSKTVCPMLSDRCLSVCNVDVYSGQTVGWIKMPLGTEVRRPRPRRHCFRWGPSSPLPPKGAQQPLPLFRLCLLWRNDRPSQQLLTSCYSEFLYFCLFPPPENCPSYAGSGRHLINGSLCPPESTTKPASRSVQPSLGDCNTVRPVLSDCCLSVCVS